MLKEFESILPDYIQDTGKDQETSHRVAEALSHIAESFREMGMDCARRSKLVPDYGRFLNASMVFFETADPDYAAPMADFIQDYFMAGYNAAMIDLETTKEGATS